MVNPATALAFFLVTVVAALNVVATVCASRSEVYRASQKALQLALVWAVPFVGSILVLGVWAYDRKSVTRDPVRHDEGPWLPGIGPENGHGGAGGDPGNSTPGE